MSNYSNDKFKIIWTERDVYDTIYSFYKNERTQIYCDYLNHFKHTSMVFVELMKNELNKIQDFKHVESTKILSELVVYYKFYQKMKNVYKDLGYPIYTKKHEDLLINPEKTLKEICNFLDINWDNKLLNHHLYKGNSLMEKDIEAKRGHPSRKLFISDIGQGLREFDQSQIDLINILMEI